MSSNALIIVSPAVLPAATLSVEKVASASTFAGESTYTTLIPAAIASCNAPEMESGPLAATMMASYPFATALFTHSICCASSFVFGALKSSVTPFALASASAPSFRFNQYWSMESIVINAILTSPPAVLLSALDASDCVPAFALLLDALPPPHPTSDVTASAIQHNAANTFFFIVSYPP